MILEKMALIFYFKVQMKAYESIIPVEVGVGRKDKSQIAKAINRYKSEHGIVISNRTSKIKKEGTIIFIPLVTFSFIQEI